jgi:L-aminopeptidase/D-esterase-like protein
MRNLITDVPGLRVGHAQDARVRSGVTVVLPDEPAAASVSVMGGAPGTRETDLLAPSRLVDRVDAIVLSGGSAFGLAAADGVMAWLAERGRGFRLGEVAVPIVPAAIVFDLANGGNKNWGKTPPYRRLGEKAVAAAAVDFALGNVGAGLGCRAGGLKGGLGSASVRGSDGVTVGAIVAVNSFGGVTLPGLAAFWAAPFEQSGEFGAVPWPTPLPAIPEFVPEKRPLAANTTIAVVATDAALDKASLERIAVMAQDGLARAIRPIHTPFDGDAVFALATGRRKVEGARALMRIGSLAADCLARAVARGVYEARTIETLVAWRDRFEALAPRAPTPQHRAKRLPRKGRP